MDPIHTIRFGYIKVSIFRTATRAGDRHQVRVCRLYRNGDAWAQSSLFSARDEVLILAQALQYAYVWVQDHSQAEGVAAAKEQIE